MDFETLFAQIGLKETGRESFRAIHARLADPVFARTLTEAFDAFDEGDNAFSAFLEAFAEQENLPVEVLNLYIYVRLSERALARCREMGMEDSVFYETAQTFTSSCRYLQERTGVYGISQDPHRAWLRRFLSNQIYRFGRLEFELVRSRYDVTLDGHAVRVGDPCLSVHIPRYLKFSEALCEEAYTRARAFFKKYYGMDTCVFFCASWLLHPWLAENLGEGSSIVNFQSKYKILERFETEEAVLHMIKNVFLFPCKYINDYPEDTSLQRLVKQRLRTGAPLGEACGFRL